MGNYSKNAPANRQLGDCLSLSLSLKNSSVYFVNVECECVNVHKNIYKVNDIYSPGVYFITNIQIHILKHTHTLTLTHNTKRERKFRRKPISPGGQNQLNNCTSLYKLSELLMICGSKLLIV